MASKNPLQKQLDDQRFAKAVHYVEQASGSIKKITSGELMHLNQVITDTSEEVWRLEPVQVTIPSGVLHHFNLISNPINKARDIIGIALQLAGNQEVKKAALYIYTELVLAHLFRDANRRTAVLATIWVLALGGIKVDAQKLLEIPLGDLRSPDQFKIFTEKFETLLVKN